MRIIDKKEIILEYGKDTDNIELFEFKRGIEIRVNGKRIQLMFGDANRLAECICELTSRIDNEKQKFKDMDCC
jgi:hypothetical protein